MRIVFWVVVPILAIGAAMYWFFSDDPVAPISRSSFPEPPTPRLTAAAVDSKPTDVLDDKPVDNVAQALIVDSFQISAQTSVEGWKTLTDPAGRLDQIILKSSGLALQENVPLESDELIDVQGWAGDPNLGIQYREILFSMCGKFVGRAQVSYDRPDVAKVFHPNLMRSGWHAELYVGDLPRCEDPKLSAWAVLRNVPETLFPLVNQVRLVAKENSRPGLERFSAQIPIGEDFFRPFTKSHVEIKVIRANLRRCGNTECNVVEKIDRGNYEAIVLEKAAGWSLLLFSDRSGWLFDELFRIVE